MLGGGHRLLVTKLLVNCGEVVRVAPLLFDPKNTDCFMKSLLTKDWTQTFTNPPKTPNTRLSGLTHLQQKRVQAWICCSGTRTTVEPSSPCQGKGPIGRSNGSTEDRPTFGAGQNPQEPGPADPPNGPAVSRRRSLRSVRSVSSRSLRARHVVGKSWKQRLVSNIQATHGTACNYHGLTFVAFSEGSRSNDPSKRSETT